MNATRVADSIWLTLAVGSFALAVFLAHEHGWVILHAVLLIVAGACLAGLWLPPSIKVNCALLLVSTVFAIYGAELILTDALPKSTPSGWAGWMAWSRDQLDSPWEHMGRENGNFDSRNRLQVIQDLAKQGIEAYPPIGANLLLGPNASHSLVSMIRINGVEVLPFGGISNKVTVYCNENGHYTIYRSDEYGFHNPMGIWSAPSLDIAVVGDSFVHGACVPTDKNFVALIRQKYPATVNLAMGANGPLIELATIREYLIAVKPKLVFWVYYEGNDLTDLAAEKDSHLLMSYLSDAAGQGLLNKQSAIDRALTSHVKRVMKDIDIAAVEDRWQIQESFLKLSHLRESLKQVKLLATEERPGTDQSLRASQETIDLFGNVLRKADQSVKGWGGGMAFVYLPHWARYGRPAQARQDREQVLRLVHDLGISVIDIHKTFAAQKDPLDLFPFRLQGHYNEKGNRIIAQEMLQFIGNFSSLRKATEGSPNGISRRPAQYGGKHEQHRLL